MADWQPITTAPSDGTLVELKRDLSSRRPTVGIGYFGVPQTRKDGFRVNGGLPTWLNATGEFLFPDPTHWRPLAADARTSSRVDRQRGADGAGSGRRSR